MFRCTNQEELRSSTCLLLAHVEHSLFWPLSFKLRRKGSTELIPAIPVIYVWQAEDVISKLQSLTLLLWNAIKFWGVYVFLMRELNCLHTQWFLCKWKLCRLWMSSRRLNVPWQSVGHGLWHEVSHRWPQQSQAIFSFGKTTVALQIKSQKLCVWRNGPFWWWTTLTPLSCWRCTYENLHTYLQGHISSFYALHVLIMSYFRTETASIYRSVHICSIKKLLWKNSCNLIKSTMYFNWMHYDTIVELCLIFSNTFATFTCWQEGSIDVLHMMSQVMWCSGTANIFPVV